MAQPDPRAFDEGPHGQELIQIELDLKSWPEPNAKRQHFIPRFLLNRFAGSGERLFQLKTRTGAPQKVAAKRAASRRGFYTFADDDGKKSNLVEGIFGMVEGHAAPALRRLEEEGAADDVDRATIALFLAYLWARTPAVRRQVEEMTQEASAGFLASHIADRGAFEELLAEHASEDPDMRKTPEEAEELRRRTLKMLADGSLRATYPDGGAATNMSIEIAHENSMLFFTEMKWSLLRADGAEFITSDRGVVGFDPTPQHPWSAATIFSSPNARTYFPISAECCLVLSPGEPVLEVERVDRSTVTETNLRIYGWADEYIFGRTQETVTGVRRALKRKPHLAVAPRPNRQVMLIERDPGDDRLARAHLTRGWDPYVVERGEDGRLRQMDYMVIGEDGDAVEIALSGEELVRRRAYKAAGIDPDSGILLPGRVATKALDPGGLRPSLR